MEFREIRLLRKGFQIKPNTSVLDLNKKFELNKKFGSIAIGTALVSPPICDASPGPDISYFMGRSRHARATCAFNTSVT
ncbi:MAG: hypothetical protein NVSMB58_37120 [Terriglobales bacterium]